MKAKATNIQFAATKDETTKIVTIAKRACRIAGDTFDTMTTIMDIDAVHSNGCPLDIEGLAKASDADLAHDVFGIRRHIDRSTGKLTDCFIPRYARPYPI